MEGKGERGVIDRADGVCLSMGEKIGRCVVVVVVVMNSVIDGYEKMEMLGFD